LYAIQERLIAGTGPREKGCLLGWRVDFDRREEQFFDRCRCDGHSVGPANFAALFL
jgi:hypothetical protein